jgi:hypothetical protein
VTAPEWRDCADPDELAAAVAAGVEVLLVVQSFDPRPTNCVTDTEFADNMNVGAAYRVPTAWTYLGTFPRRPEPPAPDDTTEPPCQKCGHYEPDVVVPSPLWNYVMRGNDIDGPALYGDLVCARCFIGLAVEAGVEHGWRLTTTAMPEGLVYETPSGRVWDHSAWMWVEPPATDNLAARARRHADTHPESRDLIEELLGAWDQLADRAAEAQAAAWDQRLNWTGKWPTPPDGCEAVFLPTDVVDHYVSAEPPSGRWERQASFVVDACREAQARRGTTPTTPGGDPRDAVRLLDLAWGVIANADGWDDDTSWRQAAERWRDGYHRFLDALREEPTAPPAPTPPPAPPWPGVVLSGLCDEDGQPTWLALAGDVRGEQARQYRDDEWCGSYNETDEWSETAWVEVRAPRAVPEPETERVPVLDAIRDRIELTHPEGEFLAVGVELREDGDLVAIEQQEPWGKAQPVAPDGTVEVLRDGGR